MNLSMVRVVIGWILMCKNLNLTLQTTAFGKDSSDSKGFKIILAQKELGALRAVIKKRWL